MRRAASAIIARLAAIRERAAVLRSRLVAGGEAAHATTYWARLRSYHLAPDTAQDMERSRWLADTVVPRLGLHSLLEVGTNRGRNLIVIKETHLDMRLAGTDVNPRALQVARAKRRDIDFRIADAHKWTEPPDSWDAILTMSVLDHIPDEAVERLAANMVRTARYVICVELWDGSPGERSLYKYSRDTRALFERHGFRTLTWERSVGQYDLAHSELWSYIGTRGG